MKVYVITEADYESTTIWAIFSSAVKAAEWFKSKHPRATRNFPNRFLSIVCYELDSYAYDPDYEIGELEVEAEWKKLINAAVVE